MKKVIVITGGSEGLGKAIAKQLAPNNQVIICAVNEDKLKAAANEIGCEYFVCDVTKNEQIEGMIKQVLVKYKRIDVLVNNAGLWIQGELDQNDPDKIKSLFEVNALGTILFSRSVIPVMKNQKSGWILNVISQAGFYGKAERSVYNASKWAITGFTKSLEMELAKFGIKVVGLYPGMMKTHIFQKVGIEKDTTNGLEVDEVAKIVEFIISFDSPLTFPEIGFKNINQ
jgi:NADP-dependent 3-hydroxy acid dehydrogenase YdfG